MTRPSPPLLPGPTSTRIGHWSMLPCSLATRAVATLRPACSMRIWLVSPYSRSARDSISRISETLTTLISSSLPPILHTYLSRRLYTFIITSFPNYQIRLAGFVTLARECAKQVQVVSEIRGGKEFLPDVLSSIFSHLASQMRILDE